jgi:hypothetical protein
MLALMGAGAATAAGIGRAAADAAHPVIEWNTHMFARDTVKFP